MIPLLLLYLVHQANAATTSQRDCLEVDYRSRMTSIGTQGWYATTCWAHVTAKLFEEHQQVAVDGTSCEKALTADDIVECSSVSTAYAVEPALRDAFEKFAPDADYRLAIHASTEIFQNPYAKPAPGDEYRQPVRGLKKSALRALSEGRSFALSYLAVLIPRKVSHAIVVNAMRWNKAKARCEVHVLNSDPRREPQTGWTDFDDLLGWVATRVTWIRGGK